MSDKPKLNLIKEEFFRHIGSYYDHEGSSYHSVESVIDECREKANQIIQDWYEKEFKVGYSAEDEVDLAKPFCITSRETEYDKYRIIYKTEPLEEEKVECEHVEGTYDQGYKKWEQYDYCHKCGEKLNDK